jgi:amino-acid N-acetyltransferase
MSVQVPKGARPGRGATVFRNVPEQAGEFVAWFRSAARYINAFRERVFVIAFGGEVVQDGKFIELTHDLNLLESLGVRLVLVHGARPQIEEELKQRGLESHFANGLRITDPDAMRCVREANGTVRVEIESLLSMGLANSPMAGSHIRVASGNSVTARPVGVVGGVDYQFTGVVRKIDVEGIRRRLEDEEIVLLSPIGYSPTGEVFNLTLEDVATSAAIALSADKLVFLMDTAGAVDPKGELLAELTAQRAEELLSSKLPQAEDVSLYLPCAIRACRAGVDRAHLISRHLDGALLLELFTRDGVGTMVTRGPLENLRAATIEDVGGILRIIEPLEADGTLVYRGREILENEIDRFTVLERDGRVIACVALYPFSDGKSAELAALCVDQEFRGGGRGDTLLRSIEERARARGVEDLFVLSTRTAHWFLERGFQETGVEQLPDEKRQMYNYQRRSKVCVKRLARR